MYCRRVSGEQYSLMVRRSQARWAEDLLVNVGVPLTSPLEPEHSVRLSAVLNGAPGRGLPAHDWGRPARSGTIEDWLFHIGDVFG